MSPLQDADMGLWPHAPAAAVVAGKPSVTTGEQAIQWAPLSRPERISFAGTSYDAVRAALEEAFGNFPLRLSRENHSVVLVGMVCAAGPARKPYQDILTALKQFGELEITTV